ncbi:MAG: hypothetical protein L0229_13970 [Blastocatellia bacterium]|nr:hypothetical protein [Blastocatellia bacterium]
MEMAQSAYDEIVDMFARGTTSADILAFRSSNKAGELTEEEAAELERFGELEHLMQLVKARAHLYVEGRL